MNHLSRLGSAVAGALERRRPGAGGTGPPSGDRLEGSLSLPSTLRWTTDADLVLTSFRSGPGPMAEQRREAHDGVPLEDLFSGEVVEHHRMTLKGEAIGYAFGWKGRSYEAVIEPLRSEDGRVTGVVGLAVTNNPRRPAGREGGLHRRIVDAIGQAVVVSDPEGRVTFWNRAAQKLYGWTPEEAVGRAVVELTVPDIAREQADEIMAALGRGNAWSGELTVRRRDGSAFQALVTNNPILDDDGRITGIIGISADITEIKRAEHALREQSERREVLATLGKEALGETTKQALMNRTVELVAEVLDAEMAAVMELSPEGDELLLRAGAGWAPGAAGSASVPSGRSSPGGLAILSGEDVVFERIDAEQRFDVPALLTSHGVMSGVALPVGTRELPFGTLEVYTASARSFEGDDIAFLRAVATVLGNARRQGAAQHALEVSEKRYRDLSEMTSDYAFSMSMDVDGRPVLDWATDSWSRATGFTTGEANEQGLLNLVVPEDLERTEAALKRVLAGWPASEELRMRTKSGDVRWLRLFARPTFDQARQRVIGLHGVVQDFSEQKRAELQLHETNQMLHALINSAPIAICAFDDDRVVQLWNRTAERMFGWQAAEIVGRPYPIVPEDRRDEFEGLVQRALEDETVTEVETVRRRKDGSLLDVSVATAPMFDTDRRITGLMTVLIDTSVRKRAERALRETEERYRTLFEGIPVGVYRTTPDGKVLSGNPALRELLGCSDDEEMHAAAAGGFYADPADRERWKALLAEEGRVVNHEMEHRRLDGASIWVRDNARAVRDESGAIVYYEGTLEDVTESRHAQEAVRHLAAIVESSDHAIIGVGLEGRIISWNRGAERLFGYAEREAVGRSIAMLVPPDRAEEARAIIERVTRGEQMHLETVRLRKDGSPVDITLTVSPILDLDGHVLAQSGIAHDISERKRAEDELRRSQVLLADGERLAGLGSWEMDLGTRELLWSEAMYRFAGVEPRAIEPSLDLLLERVHPDDRELAGALFDPSAGSSSGELRIVRPDGSIRYISVETRVIAGEGVEATRAIGTALDVTDRRRGEQELRSMLDELRRVDEERRHLLSQVVSAQEEERRRLAADIHDDSIQIMTAVRLQLDALAHTAEGADAAAAVSTLKATVTSAIGRLRSLLFELHPGALDRGGLAAAVRELLEKGRADEDYDFQLESRLGREVPAQASVIAYRIIQEALANVRRHTRGAMVKIVLADRDEGIYAAIRDDGQGFDPAGSTRPAQEHLGLVGMRERAETAGGWWRIESAPGAGTLVELWIPDEIPAPGQGRGGSTIP